MPPGKMHEHEVDTSVLLVARLLAAQFPQWASLPIEPVPSAGTDNALYRLGSDKVVRLPRINWAVEQVEKEHRWLPQLASRLPLPVPVPHAMGEPGEGYPWHWAIYRWLEGENATVARILEPIQAAIDLANFLNALQEIDPTGGPRPGEHDLARGKPLALRDRYTREAIAALDGMIDGDAVTKAWEAALQAPEWNRAPAWFHGDLLPGNLLIEEGRLSAVIDWGNLGIGDPACDLMVAWGLFTGKSREAFRKALAIDDTTWARGRGLALSQALIFIPYYLETNPIGVSLARRTIDEILTDDPASG